MLPVFHKEPGSIVLTDLKQTKTTKWINAIQNQIHIKLTKNKETKSLTVTHVCLKPSNEDKASPGVQF